MSLLRCKVIIAFNSMFHLTNQQSFRLKYNKNIYSFHDYRVILQRQRLHKRFSAICNPHLLEELSGKVSFQFSIFQVFSVSEAKRKLLSQNWLSDLNLLRGWSKFLFLYLNVTSTSSDVYIKQDNCVKSQLSLISICSFSCSKSFC